LAAMIGPPAKATSMRTESGDSGNGYDLRENAVDGVGVDKGDLQAEEAAAGNGVDQLGALRGEAVECGCDVFHLVCEVVDAGTAAGEEAADRGVLAGGSEQLDPACTDEHRGRLDSLVGDELTVLERSSEEAHIGGHGLVEVGDGKADVVDAARLHDSDATSRALARATVSWRCGSATALHSRAKRGSKHSPEDAAIRFVVAASSGALERAHGADGLGRARLTREVAHHGEELVPVDRLLLEQRSREPVE